MLEAIVIGVAALGGSADALITLAGGAVVVGFAGGDFCGRHTIAAGGADPVIGAVAVGDTGLCARAVAADAICAVCIVGANTQTVITGTILVLVHIVASKAAGADDEDSQKGEEKAAQGIGKIPDSLRP